ncbi:MAG: hypothetical protein Rpha_2153 [Candidatus Ruthia sp. Apha_13_S6]|nr:hypothetical protein [Candidatus Ruthia sp. Apha_13_S6]
MKLALTCATTATLPDEKVLGMVMGLAQAPFVNKADTMVKIILCVVMVVLLKVKCLLFVFIIAKCSRRPN